MILLLVLIATLFATSKSIYEEIEDRTMLTLMSKPVAQVGSAGRQIPGHHPAAAAWRSRSSAWSSLILCTWWRIPGDYMLNADSLDDRELRHDLRHTA